MAKTGIQRATITLPQSVSESHGVVTGILLQRSGPDMANVPQRGEGIEPSIARFDDNHYQAALIQNRAND